MGALGDLPKPNPRGCDRDGGTRGDSRGTPPVWGETRGGPSSLLGGHGEETLQPWGVTGDTPQPWGGHKGHSGGADRTLCSALRDPRVPQNGEFCPSPVPPQPLPIHELPDLGFPPGPAAPGSSGSPSPRLVGDWSGTGRGLAGPAPRSLAALPGLQLHNRLFLPRLPLPAGTSPGDSPAGGRQPPWGPADVPAPPGDPGKPRRESRRSSRGWAGLRRFCPLGVNSSNPRLRFPRGE